MTSTLTTTATPTTRLISADIEHCERRFFLRVLRSHLNVKEKHFPFILFDPTVISRQSARAIWYNQSVHHYVPLLTITVFSSSNKNCQFNSFIQFFVDCRLSIVDCRLSIRRFDSSMDCSKFFNFSIREIVVSISTFVCFFKAFLPVRFL